MLKDVCGSTSSFSQIFSFHQVQIHHNITTNLGKRSIGRVSSIWKIKDTIMLAKTFKEICCHELVTCHNLITFSHLKKICHAFYIFELKLAHRGEHWTPWDCKRCFVGRQSRNNLHKKCLYSEGMPIFHNKGQLPWTFNSFLGSLFSIRWWYVDLTPSLGNLQNLPLGFQHS